MSEEHKAALALGKRQARAIRDYLNALESREPGRSVTKESLASRLSTARAKLAKENNSLKKVELLQTKIDIEEALSELDNAADVDELEAEFIVHVKSYSERKGIRYTAWREFGVPAATLRKAGIPETRRR